MTGLSRNRHDFAGMGARILVVDDSRTIRKVVSTILEANSFEPIGATDGQDALEKLRAEGDVDLVLLDFVMPRMNGYQFCREVRADDELKSLPVVLMSAKGDKIRGQFVRQTGAIDAITKPFDARGLIAVVESALKKTEEGRAPEAPDAALMPEEEEDAAPESLKPGSISLSADPGLRRVQAAHEVASALAKVVLPELKKVASDLDDADTALTDAIERAMTVDNCTALSTLIKHLDFGEGTRQVLTGDVAVISIAEVLQLLNMQRQNGAMTITTRSSRGPAEVVLYLRGGDLDLARSHSLREEFLLGRYLVEDGAVTRDELDHFLSNRAGSKRLMGEALMQLGMAGEEQVKKALERQSSELVYEVVRWKRGRFTFDVDATTPEAEFAQLGLPTNALIMEGFRRVDEWRLIEGSFDFDEVLSPDSVAIERLGDTTKLTRLERSVLQAIDGERTVREIVDAIRGSAFDVSKIIYQFLNSRLVVRRSAA